MRPERDETGTAAMEARPARRSTDDFARMVLPYRTSGYNLARWLLRHDEDAEDCVQEALFRAFRAFGQFRGEDARGWLLAIVRNTCYLHIRQRRRAGFSAPFDEVLHSQTDDAVQSEPVESDSLAQQILPQALERLPAQTRTILVLREIEGRAYKDIKIMMGIPLGTVMSRLSRARNRLQHEVKGLLRQTSAYDCRGAGGR